jgi:hypothetical protein
VGRDRVGFAPHGSSTAPHETHQFQHVALGQNGLAVKGPIHDLRIALHNGPLLVKGEFFDSVFIKELQTMCRFERNGSLFLFQELNSL